MVGTAQERLCPPYSLLINHIPSAGQFTIHGMPN
jgi:hypothetical protein